VIGALVFDRYFILLQYNLTDLPLHYSYEIRLAGAVRSRNLYHINGRVYQGEWSHSILTSVLESKFILSNYFS